MHKFVGVSPRSKKGCQSCRQRKKKCDEVHPVCGLCSKRSGVCVWNTDFVDKFKMDKVIKSQKLAAKSKIPKTQELVFINESTALLNNIVSHIKSPHFNPTANVMDGIINSALVLHNNKHPCIPVHDFNDNISSLTVVVDDDDDDDDDEYLPMDESHMLENIFLNDIELLSVFKSKTFQSYLKPSIHALFNKNDITNFITPNNSMLKHLDSNGILFLEHYVSYIASHQLDIGNKKFFLDYAISAASKHKSILFCLVAWGGMFLLNRSNENAHHYLTNSRSLISKFRINIQSNDELLTTLSFYVLTLTSEITTGDVSIWYQMLLNCKDLINQFGGFKNFIYVNKNSNIAKWIISSIFFHDVLSARALEHGTMFPMSDYEEIKNHNNFFNDENYGLDPFQGLSYELYLIMGEFINNRLNFKNIEFRIKLIDPSNLNYNKNLNKLYSKIENDFIIFNKKIDDCKPPVQMINEILKLNDDLFLECHLTLFEITQISLKIFLRISFIQKPFDDFEIQNLKSNGDKLFKILVNSKLKSMLCLPLLMLGIVSIKINQREKMNEMYQNLLLNCDIKNITVCWEIIKQVWKSLDLQLINNPNGIIFIDWTEILNSLGWNCCFT